MPKSGLESDNTTNKDQLKSKLDTLSKEAVSLYSRIRTERVVEAIDQCANLIRKDPLLLTSDLLTDFLEKAPSNNDRISSFTGRLIELYLEHGQKNREQEYRNLMPSLIAGNHQRQINKMFKDVPTLINELEKWVSIAARYEDSGVGSALCLFKPEAISLELHAKAYKGKSSKHAEHLEEEVKKHYPNGEALQEAISEQGNNAYKQLLQNIQHRDFIEEGWQYSRQNDEEISFSTQFQNVKLTRVFNFKSQQMTQITEASEKLCTDIQNFADIEHDAEICQARKYLNMLHGKTEANPNSKSKLKISPKRP